MSSCWAECSRKEERILSVERRLSAVVSGDVDAWSALVGELLPRLCMWASQHRLLRAKGHTGEDDVAEIATATMERLRAHDFRNLEHYLRQHEELGEVAAQSFDSWLYGALDYCVRDYLRSRYGRAPQALRAAELVLPSKRDLGTLADRFPTGQEPAARFAQLGVTQQLTIAEVMQVVQTEFNETERTAFELYFFRDLGLEQVAAKLDLEDAKAADRLIRRLNARLRHRFRER